MFRQDRGNNLIVDIGRLGAICPWVIISALKRQTFWSHLPWGNNIGTERVNNFLLSKE
jgi:hypothetical protein